jgi:long-chain acyl-CoA synthetase
VGARDQFRGPTVRRQQGEARASEQGGLGRPAGARLRDRHPRPVTGEELPTGQAGEICERGDNVMAATGTGRTLSAAALRDGWLHTGDAGYLDQHGYLYVTGRITEMITTGGENVYPAEVENVLYAHPAVAEAAVVGLPGSHWRQRIHAVIAPVPGMSPDTAGIIAFCRERLAGYKCPRSVDIRDALPKTGAGKIDKRSLSGEANRAG